MRSAQGEYSHDEDGASGNQSFAREKVVATATPNADDIRLRMAQIRRELHSDVRGVVANAEAVTDWRRYIRMYPWAALGTSVALGYFLVPRRHAPVESIPSNAASELTQVVETLKETEPVASAPARKGLLAAAFGFLSPIALRAAQGYASQYLENWIAQQQEGFGPASEPSSAQPGAEDWGRTTRHPSV